MNGAIAAYKEARDKAAALYYSDGKDEAMKKEAAAEQKADKAEEKGPGPVPGGSPGIKAAAESPGSGTEGPGR